MRLGFSLDPRLQLDAGDELALVKRGAELGYESVWTPATPEPEAFDRCLRWYEAAGLPVGIAVVPASGQPPDVYAERYGVRALPSSFFINRQGNLSALAIGPRAWDTKPAYAVVESLLK